MGQENNSAFDAKRAQQRDREKMRRDLTKARREERVHISKAQAALVRDAQLARIKHERTRRRPAVDAALDHAGPPHDRADP